MGRLCWRSTSACWETWSSRLQTLKPRNVFRRSDVVGAAVVEALDAAEEWIEAAREPAARVEG